MNGEQSTGGDDASASSNTNVYVDGGYKYRPRITELHMANNEGALWNPTLSEIPSTLHAAVMKKAKVAILYDGWIDIENIGHRKPIGATREGEILGYDIYAKSGERFTPITTGGKITGYTYTDGGTYENSDEVSYTWSVMHLYRAMGIEQTEFNVYTEGRTPEEYDINTSPLVQYLTMDTDPPDLSAVVSNVAATRTNPDLYLSIAEKDGLNVAPAEDRESQYLTLGEFCVLAYSLMQLYGEPVITDRETYALLEAYGRYLPYGLPSVQLEAVKYLMARGIVEYDMDWRSNIKFKDAATILMRIKDTSSRLTFKEISITTPIELLSRGYYPTEITNYQAPIEVLNQRQEYTAYTDYDYFVECVDGIKFRAETGFHSIPFMCAGDDNTYGVVAGSSYLGRVVVEGREFYHFRVKQDVEFKNSIVYINTPVSADTPYMYALPAPADGNVGGFWLYTGSGNGSEKIVSEWKWSILDGTEGVAVVFPAEYCDYARKLEATKTEDTQLGLFNESSYGFTLRVYNDDLDKVSVFINDTDKMKLSSVTGVVSIKSGAKIERSQYAGRYKTFTVTGCSNKNTLSELFVCGAGTSYQSFPAFSKNSDQYLVSIDYLKSIGVVWEFAKTSDTMYYIGVKSPGTDMYTDVYIGTSKNYAYVIRGTQLTIYPAGTAVVWESDSTYYVDYSAVLGIQQAVTFKDNNGDISLSVGAQVEFVQLKQVENVNNVVGKNENAHSYLPTVKVYNSKDQAATYIYAPITYPLANWIAVDIVGERSGVFTFFPTVKDKDSDGADSLRSYLGIETNATSWDVRFTAGTSEGHMQTTRDGDKIVYEGEKLPPILYVREVKAFLIRPTQLEDPQTTYREFIDGVMSGDIEAITSIVAKYGKDTFAANGYIADWNYNLYNISGDWGTGYALHKVNDNRQRAVNRICDMSAWTGEKNNHAHSDNLVGQWIPAAVGVPGMIGYPASTSYQLSRSKVVDTYTGIAWTVRGGDGAGVGTASNADGTELDSKTTLMYHPIHFTPNKSIIQSCSFTFEFLAGSVIGRNSPKAPTLTTKNSEPAFDWGEFFKNYGLQNADDWLTIAIIAVLNILPRIFMFLFIVLMSLALIADVKPWRLFCKTVIDPYKVLTAGRQDVDTIQVKRIFLYSIIALALFGLFQNGIILRVIAWFARAVVSILSR